MPADNYYESLGSRVRALRKAITPKMTQEKLAHKAGFNTVTISDLENGKNLQLKLETVRRIAEALKVPISAIVDDEVSLEAKKTLVMIENALRKERERK